MHQQVQILSYPTPGQPSKLNIFVDDMNSSEIKVLNPELSEILENVNFCINKINFSKANQRILTQVVGKWKGHSSSSGV